MTSSISVSGLLGPSGSGKTTLLRTAARVLSQLRRDPFTLGRTA